MCSSVAFSQSRLCTSRLYVLRQYFCSLCSPTETLPPVIKQGMDLTNVYYPAPVPALNIMCLCLSICLSVCLRMYAIVIYFSPWKFQIIFAQRNITLRKWVLTYEPHLPSLLSPRICQHAKLISKLHAIGASNAVQ